MERTNVLFLHHVSSLGGAERYLISLVEQLDQKFKPYFVSQNPGPLTEELAAMDVPVSYVQMRAWRRFKFAFLNLMSVRKIMRFCRENDIKIICCNAYRVAPYAVIAARRLKIPCVTVIHDFVPYIKLKRFRVFESDCVISVSENINKTVSSHLKRKAFVVYNGLNAQKFKDMVKAHKNVREELNLDSSQRIVGIVGNLIPLKGHDLFFNAMKIVSEKHPDVTFLVIGEPLDTNQMTEDDLKAKAGELGILERTRFLGYRSDVPDVIAALDVLVVASDREAFGRVLIEAMALEKPVVATRCGGPEEIVNDGENGFLVEKEDAQAMADAVSKLISDASIRERFGQNGLTAVQSKFSPENTVNRVNKILEDMLL